MKCSLGISNFLEEISSVSHSVVFLYFFALIAEEGFHISSCYSLKLRLRPVHVAGLRGVTPRPRSGAAAESARLRQKRPRGATQRPRSAAVAGKSYPMSEARGGGREELPHVQGAEAALAQEGLEELFHVQGQEGRQ